MKRASAILFAISTVVLFAGQTDPRLGTWKVTSEHDTYSPPRKLTITAETNGLHVVNSGGSRQEWTARLDGQFYAVENPDDADQVSMQRIDKDTIQRTFKRNGKIVSTARYVVSGGNELRIVNGSGEGDTFSRSGGPHDASNPFIGEWTWTEETLPKASFTFTRSGENGVHFSGPEGFGYTAQFDGKQYPTTHSRDDSVSVKVIDSHHVEERWMRGGQVGDLAHWTISADGREMSMADDGTLAAGAKVHTEMRLEKQ